MLIYWVFNFLIFTGRMTDFRKIKISVLNSVTFFLIKTENRLPKILNTAICHYFEVQYSFHGKTPLQFNKNADINKFEKSLVEICVKTL